MSGRISAMSLALFAMVSAAPASAALLKLDVTVTSVQGVRFSAPNFTFTNLSDAGHGITKVSIGNGPVWDFVHDSSFAAPYGRVSPAGGTATILVGEELGHDGNNGCTASIEYGLTGFDPGEVFKFSADPEAGGCSSAVVDTRPFMLNDQLTVGVTFSDGTSLSGSDWAMELINPLGDPDADGNQLFRLVLTAQSGDVGPVPEPASWAMMIAGFGIVGGAMRRRRPALTFA